MLILKAITTSKVEPYLDFNSSVNRNALTIIDGKIVTGRIFRYCKDSNQVWIINASCELRVKESDIIGTFVEPESANINLELISTP